MTKPDRIVKFAGQEIALGGFALLLMLAAILLPTVIYSINLRQPTPAELLVSISIGMFASVLYLWVLDATDTLPFRSQWVSSGVYGAAIVSIIGTSVGVYKDAFVQPYPYQGEWLLSLRDNGATVVAQRPVALAYSRQTDVYWGYSDSPSVVSDEKQVTWLKVTSFDPLSRRLELQLRAADGTNRIYVIEGLKETKPHTAYSSDVNKRTTHDSPVSVQLARRNI